MVVNSCPDLHVYKFTGKNGEGAGTKSGKHVKSQHKMTKPDDSVKEMDILEEPSLENVDQGYMNSSK